ncbi:unnamed protein product [Camellia sinensis]
MLQSKSFVRKTKQGKVIKVVREHYLRDDIYCGAPFCNVCDSKSARLSSSAPTILIFDTNVVLNQIDLLENPAIDDVVILSVVLEEVKNKNLSVYNRIRALCSNSTRKFFVFSNEYHRDTYVKAMVGESPNDRNDREIVVSAIRVAAQWYKNHLGDATRVLLITNDRENKRKATEEGISAETVESFVKSLGQPGLLDLLVQPRSEDVGMEEVEDLRPSKRKILYTEHKPMSEITAGLHCGIFHQGKLRVNRYNPFEAYVGSESIGDEIIIYGRVNMNRAFDGDIVAVELLPQDQWHEEKSLSIADEEDEEEEGVHLVPSSADDAPRVPNPAQGSAGGANTVSSRPSGRIVGIIKRNWHSYCGSLEPMPMPAGTGGVAHALFVSKDRRFPKIRIQTRQLGNLLDKRIIVAIDSWDRLSRYPSGHYVRTIGVIGDRETESEVVLIENDIDSRPFTSQVLSCLPPLPWSVSSEDLANPIRQDLRHIRVFSVDPPGIDARILMMHYIVQLFQMEILKWEFVSFDLLVLPHIADVTNFVHPGTPLDDEATQRGTSVYLVERRIDMLPKPLTEDICSLRADVERLAFSVIWEMTPEAEIISTRFTKSVIKSYLENPEKANDGALDKVSVLAYGAQKGRRRPSRLMDLLTTDLRNMNVLAKVMRQRRIDRGALTLASAEVKFQIDTETHDPLDIGMYQIREANQMVEEFMLAANISVAAKILEHFPPCSLLRRHPSPTKEMLEPLLRTAAAVGLHLDVSTSKALADSLDCAVGDDPYFNKLIRILATRCMTQAVYFCSGDLSPQEFYHYGLSAPLYTHFTSPIRRYADVVVHRLLAASLGIYKLPAIFQDRPQLTSIADNDRTDLNYRHRNAQMASRASVEVHTLIYFRKRPTDTEARIVKIRSNGFIVFVPKYGIEGPVYLTARGDKGGGGEWLVDEQQQKVKKSDGSISYGVLQTVRIHMEVVEPQPNRIAVLLIGELNHWVWPTVFRRSGIRLANPGMRSTGKMLQSKSFVGKTKQGKVVKVVREHYLRDDIYCGAPFCNACDSESARLSSSAPTILIFDTNVVLNQIDLLENPAIDDVVILSVVLEEVKNKNLSVYNRIRALCSNSTRKFFVFSNEYHRDTYVKAMVGESPNDRNDRGAMTRVCGFPFPDIEEIVVSAIRVAAQWYKNHLGDATRVLLISNDRENKGKATEEGISAETGMNSLDILYGQGGLMKFLFISVESFVKSLGQPGLLDLLVQPRSEDVGMEEVEDLRPSKRKILYTEHKPMSEITAGLHCGIFHQGKLRVNRYNPFEAYVGSESIGDEIIIYGRVNMNRAFDGDIVAVELLPQDQWHEEKSLSIADEEDEEEEDVHLVPNSADDAPRVPNPAQGSAGGANTVSSRPSGRVVGIIKRNWHSYCGSLEPMPMPAGTGGVAHALFVSKDRRFPKIRIQTRQLGNLLDKRIFVAVDSWDCLSRYPSGHYVRTIGVIGDRETESEVVLIENDIDSRPFTSQVLSCLPPLPWSVSSEDLANPIRQDLRHIRVFSVDPPDARILMMHYIVQLFQMENLKLEFVSSDLLVLPHIADVTNFVHPGTPLDDEATQRGISVYLVERRIDMLPKPLTEDICALRADVERLAFSVIWEMTPEAEIISTRFTKSVIKSCATLSYVEAQARMDDRYLENPEKANDGALDKVSMLAYGAQKGRRRPRWNRLMDPLTTNLRNMNVLAKVMRQRRIDRGALTLASAEVKFQIDTETHDPLDIGMYQIREANQMVEEFMLAANISVAAKILEHFPPCSLLRRHPSPTKEMLEPLLRMAAAVGLHFDVSTSKALADSLDCAVGDDPYFNKLIRILATRCMTQAVYFRSGDLSPQEFYHYGLSAPLYTHFTSPIRRYADVVVHRLLAASLGIYKLPAIFQDRPQLTSIADRMLRWPTDTEARIVKVRSNGFIVFVPKYGIEGPVYLTARGDKGGGREWLVDEQQQKVKKSDGGISYGVLQTVRVHMEVVEPQPNRIAVLLIGELNHWVWPTVFRRSGIRLANPGMRSTV